MSVKVTTHEYELNFFDGPAKGQVIQMSVEPTKRRWFCKRLDYAWWSIYKPPTDHLTEVVEYEVAGYAPRKDGALVNYKLASND